jgi:hypothetical protein
VIHQIDAHNKEYLVGVLRVILKTNDLEIVKYTIESLIEELEESEIIEIAQENPEEFDR